MVYYYLFDAFISLLSIIFRFPSSFIIVSLVFSYLSKVLFSGFLQFKRNFVDGQNISKYRDCSPLKRLSSLIVKNNYTLLSFSVFNVVSSSRQDWKCS